MLDYEELMITIIPPLKPNGAINGWYKWILRLTFFISCIGIITPIVYMLNAILWITSGHHEYEPDWVLIINLIIVFIVSASAIFAYRYDSRSGYLPMLAYLVSFLN